MVGQRVYFRTISNHRFFMTSSSQPTPPDAPLMRIQKYLAHRGIASRRQVEDWIQEGSLKINGKLATLGAKVDPEKDHVIADGRHIKPGAFLPQHVTFMLYKPKGYICSHKDPLHTQTVYKLLPAPYRKRKFICAGRLDKDSEGLVILTTDGALAQFIMHPSNEVLKRYKVVLDIPLQPQQVETLRKGVWDEDEFLLPKKIIPSRTGLTQKFEVHLNEGRKREIRRLFQAEGANVQKLKRIQIGKVKLLQDSVPGDFAKIEVGIKDFS
jgi:23S rRNA pseudouridine2605 synthase